ncbi:uncharacterized protein LOC111831222 isoform X2 [Capsella rubella]|uniref:uncharacterized protein LOC111831222 isoform X2 n=1 Tax=Capsella rubella TaxID=81985 RepID=UPI000CD4B3CE|nr:uncharacterized protein LOC111831222 isoform X2 [Capsella rubella]
MLLFYINVVNKQQSRIAHLDSRFSSKKIFNPISSLPFLIVKLLVLVKVQSESMSSSPTQSSTSVSPGHVVQINSYSRPRYLIDILHILAGLPELQTLLSSPLSALFSLLVRYCSLFGQLVHQMLCRQLCTPNSDAMWFVYRGQPLCFSLLEFVQLTSLSCAPSLPTAELVAATTHFDSFAPYWYTLIGRTLGRRPLRIWSPC